VGESGDTGDWSEADRNDPEIARSGLVAHLVGSGSWLVETWDSDPVYAAGGAGLSGPDGPGRIRTDVTELLAGGAAWGHAVLDQGSSKGWHQVGNTDHTRARRWRARSAAALAAVGALIASTGVVLMATASTAHADPSVHKVFVCKYVRTPGGDHELLQTGQNPISVDTNALEKEGFTAVYPSESQFPFWYEDGHDKSVAFAWDTEQGDGQGGEPGLEDCPAFPEDEDETEVAANVVFRDPTCADKTAGYTTSATVDGSAAASGLVEFDVTSGSVAPGQSVTITATITDDDYEFDNEDTEQAFSHTFGSVPTNCEQAPTSVTVGVSFTDPTCAVPGVAWAATVDGQPDGPADHVTFAAQGTQAAGQAVTVTATADAGYVITGPSSFQHTFAAVPANCSPAVVPPAPAPGEVAGTESAAPKPSKKPAVKPTKASKPQILGSEAAVPTAVDAGLGSVPAAAPAPGSLLGQLLAGAGAALMLAAGWLMTAGRRKVGAREA
jgi:hypothetical protein